MQWQIRYALETLNQCVIIGRSVTSSGNARALQTTMYKSIIEAKARKI